MIKTTLLAACILCAGIGPAFAQSTAPAPPAAQKSITSATVWHPSSGTLAAIRKKCQAGNPANLESCTLNGMTHDNASASAIAFSKSLADKGVIYMRAFRRLGLVDVGYIEYVFRANELQGEMLVNGDPSPIDVDDPKFLTKDMLQQNSVYATLTEKYPNASVWPADRMNPRLPVARTRPKGGQDFLVRYLLRDGCHACAEIGTARVLFSFDAAGKFTGTRLQNVVPGTPPSSDKPTEKDPAGPEGASAAPRELHAIAGKQFTITLAANHTTGYSWQLASALDPALIEKIGMDYHQSAAPKAGSGGEEIWTFAPKSKGTVALEFQYLRPFEKGVPPVKTAKYQVIIG